MRMIKNFARVGLVGLAILAIALFTACPEDDNGKKPDPTYTYTLSVADVARNMSAEQQTVQLNPTITTKPAGGTIPAGTYSLSCATCPSCDLSVSGSTGTLIIPASFGPDTAGSKDYNLTLTWTRGGQQTTSANFKLTITRAPIAFGTVKVKDKTLYRLGAPDAEREIEFDVLDTLGIITNDFRSDITLEVGSSGKLTIENKAGKLVIAENASLEIGEEIDVSIIVKRSGTAIEDSPQTIKVTVAALMYEIKYFRVVSGTPAEITATGFQRSVEHGQKITLPNNLNHSAGGFLYTHTGGAWKSGSATGTDWNFETQTVTGATSLYSEYTAEESTWTATFVITIGSEQTAQLLEGETIWIKDVTDSWVDYALTKDTDGKWKGSIENLNKSPARFSYRIMAVPPGGNPDSQGYLAQPADFVVNYQTAWGSTHEFTYTVTNWIRPVTEEGELLKKNMMNGGSQWSVYVLEPEWTLTGFESEMYFTSDSGNNGPGIRPPNNQYFRMWHRDGNRDNITDSPGIGVMTQKVAVSGVDAQDNAYTLAAGDDVTFYVWVSRFNDSVSEVKLFIGAQEYTIPHAQLPLGGGSSSWIKVTFVTKLIAADIVEGGINVGISIEKIKGAAGGCRFSIDSLSFSKGVKGTTGVPVRYTLTAEDVNVAPDATEDLDITVTTSDASVPTGLTYAYTCAHPACAMISFNTTANTVTAIASATTSEHNITATISKDGSVVATTTFTVYVLEAGAVIRHFTVQNVAIDPGETKTITYDITSSNHDETKEDFTLSYECSCEGCDLNFVNNTVTGTAVKVHTVTATAKKTGDEEVVLTDTFTVTVALTKYTVTANITITAEMLEGEVPYIAGSFYGSNWGNSGGTRKLTQVDTSNVWTATLANVPIATQDVKYNIFIGDDEAMGWTIKAHAVDLEFTANGTAAFTLAYNVIEWHGRPVELAGNLLGNPSFNADGTIGWALNNTGHWDVSGYLVGAEGFFPNSNDGGASNGKIGSSFADANWDGARLADGATGTVFQNVPAAGTIPGTSDAYTLTAGVKLKALAWINRKVGEHTSINIVIGIEVISVLEQLEGTGWQLAEVEYTLTENDIVDDKVYFGVRYTSGAPGSIMGVDECYLGIVE